MKLSTSILALGVSLMAMAANAQGTVTQLYIIGGATPGGWDLNMAQALQPTAEHPAVFTGTIYLKGGSDNTFKFMETHEFLGTEYGLSEAGAVDGEFTLASGTHDEGYSQMYVAQEGNYLITIDTENLKGEITRSEYQDTPIDYCSLFMVGSATPGGWSVDAGTPLVQVAATPYKYTTVVALKADGSFKIATAIRGGGTFDTKYFYFKDADDAGKISTDSTDDRQWVVDTDGDYVVTVNTVDSTISIAPYDPIAAGIEDVEVAEGEAVYYNLQGVKIANPANGVYVKVIGGKAIKVML